MRTVESNYLALIEALHKLDNKVDAKLDMVLMQISKIAVIESDIRHSSDAMERAFQAIATVEKRVADLQQFQNETKGASKVVWMAISALGAVALAMIGKVF
jgi:hypothetical protein